ncbi:Asp23/Gls24 family envelope stress response protein [Amycolatopsis sp. PS_44_ISF1]|uniref:Asp23/Gls24 family envelope stress response protein n=1 Tax=Amycolatopsis sp. PS_44_ISF1 TaxID=2974917 RepID=UPI0028E09799|nr:Asp23/Gls24 family envelope stress response protein [Amycolatopsis sp. PS_44_ISF1]MDT8914056.1 Asp23/Gls24 family envelope stress response protein [Amycolatopsis sp. PS_44_ISF1]
MVQPSPNRSAVPGPAAPAPLNEPGTPGRTTISSLVVQKVASRAAREVAGVHELGSGSSRAFGALRERIPGAGTTSTSGVSVEVGEKQAAIDLDLVVGYGVSITDVARAVRHTVISAVEAITALEVIEVNIAVNDVHLPGEPAGGPGPARVG